MECCFSPFFLKQKKFHESKNIFKIFLKLCLTKGMCYGTPEDSSALCIFPQFLGKYGKLCQKNTPKMLSAQACVLLLLKRECNVVFKSEI